jgi:hypothetical protein
LLVENYSNSPGGQTYSAATRIFIGPRANNSSKSKLCQPLFCVFAATLGCRFDSCILRIACFRQRPYFVEYTRSHPNSEVKRRKARSVLGWGTAREALRVLLAFCVRRPPGLVFHKSRTRQKRRLRERIASFSTFEPYRLRCLSGVLANLFSGGLSFCARRVLDRAT